MALEKRRTTALSRRSLLKGLGLTAAVAAVGGVAAAARVIKESAQERVLVARQTSDGFWQWDTVAQHAEVMERAAVRAQVYLGGLYRRPVS